MVNIRRKKPLNPEEEKIKRERAEARRPKKGIFQFREQRRNANAHTFRGEGLLLKSMREDGWIGAMTVANDGEAFDGSLRLRKAQKIFGKVEPIVVETDGRRPVVVKRIDIPNADDPKARKLAIAANRIAQLDLNWNPDILRDEVNLAAFDFLDVGFAEDELDLLINKEEAEVFLNEGVEGETDTALRHTEMLYPLSVLLDKRQDVAFQKFKSDNGIKDDTTAVVLLLKLAGYDG